MVVMTGDGSGVGITCVGKIVGCGILVPVVGAGIVFVGWVDTCVIITSWMLCW